MLKLYSNINSERGKMIKMVNTTHLGVYGIVIKEDKILLVKKSRGAYIGKYDLPGGSFSPCSKITAHFVFATSIRLVWC